MCVDPEGGRVFGWGEGVVHCWSSATMQLLWATEDGLQAEDRPVHAMTFDSVTGLLAGMTAGRGGVRLWSSPLVGNAVDPSGVDSGEGTRLLTGCVPAGMGVACCTALRARSGAGGDSEVGEREARAVPRLAPLCGFLCVGPREVREGEVGPGDAGPLGSGLLDGGWDSASVHTMASVDLSQSLSLTLGAQRSVSTVGR
jgi:hypothetical protein